MTETTSITVADGKYTVQHENGANLRALRYGEPWRDLVGDNLVYWMACRIEELEKESHENWCAEVNTQGRYEEACEHVKQLEDALRKIARWHGEFPPSGRKWEDGYEMSYSAAHGSNGERDYMRNVALQALNK